MEINMDEWNVVEKMEQWDTSTTTEEDILKVLKPYVDYIMDKLVALDDSILNQLDVLKKIKPMTEPFYRILINEVSQPKEAYKHAMYAIHQLPGHNNDKLKKALNDQTGLTEEDKEMILEVWEKNHKRYHCWCLPPNDTTLMEECIRTNSAVIYDYFDKEEEFTRRLDEFNMLLFRTKKEIEIFPVLSHPRAQRAQRNRRAGSTHQLKSCESTKHKRLKSSSPKASGHQLKRCESTKHKRLKSTSSPKASGHQLKRCESTKHKRLKSTSSPKASGQ